MSRKSGGGCRDRQRHSRRMVPAPRSGRSMAGSADRTRNGEGPSACSPASLRTGPPTASRRPRQPAVPSGSLHWPAVCRPGHRPSTGRQAVSRRLRAAQVQHEPDPRSDRSRRGIGRRDRSRRRDRPQGSGVARDVRDRLGARRDGGVTKPPCTGSNAHPGLALDLQGGLSEGVGHRPARQAGRHLLRGRAGTTIAVRPLRSGRPSILHVHATAPERHDHRLRRQAG